MIGDNAFVMVFLTNSCDLRCLYCSQESGPHKGGDFELIHLKTILLEARSLGFSWVCLTGGDPLTHPHFLDALDIVEESGLWLTLETNGQRVSNEIARRLAFFSKTRRCKVMISLESQEADLHDHFRGKGSHAMAINAIKILRTSGVYVQICKQLTNRDFIGGLNLDSFIDFAKSLDVNHTDIGRIIAVGRAKHGRFSLTPQQIQEARRQLLTRDDYGYYVGTDDFDTAEDRTLCPRISGLSSGLAVYSDIIAPCAFLHEFKLGKPEDLKIIAASGLVQKMEGLRRAAMVNITSNQVWGCPECRNGILTFIDELKIITNGLNTRVKSI